MGAIVLSGVSYRAVVLSGAGDRYRAISFVLALVYWRWWECYIRCQVARHRAIGRVGVQSGRLASRQQVSAIVPCIVLSGSY